MTRYAYITPLSAPVQSVAFCLEVPDDPAFWGALRGMFLDLCDPAQWEQATGIEPEDAAAAAEIILASFEERQICEP